MSRTQIDLGSVQCNTGTRDGNGILWTCGWPEGWDSPAQRGGTLDPTGRDGSVGLASFWGGRQLVVPGMCRATTQAAAWNAYYLVMGGLPGLRGEMDFVVHEPTQKGLTVVQHAQPRAEPKGINTAFSFTWQLNLRADDPLKKVATATTGTIAASASSTLTNNGTVAAYPVFTTTSSGTVDIVIGGRHFTTDSVPSGTVIDMWARTITDVPGTTLVPWPKHSAAEWLSLPPGGNSVSNAGTANLSYSFYDTYA